MGADQLREAASAALKEQRRTRLVGIRKVHLQAPLSVQCGHVRLGRGTAGDLSTPWRHFGPARRYFPMQKVEKM
jgi:hypothetical protein